MRKTRESNSLTERSSASVSPKIGAQLSIVVGSQLSRCPTCGGEVHAVAGRCKHCKEDLVAWRAKLAIANAAASAPQRQTPNGDPSVQQVPEQVQGPLARQGQVQAPTQAPTHAPRRAPTHAPEQARGRASTQAPVSSRSNAKSGIVPWWKRWPVWAGALAIFLLGLSTGMLIERMRAAPEPVASNEATTDSRDTASAFGTAPMPTDPLPSTPTPSIPAPSAPGPSTPAPSPPRSTTPDPFGLGPSPTKPAPQLGNPANPSSNPDRTVAFVGEAVDAGCEKLVSCNVVAGLSKQMCKSMVKDLGVAEAQDKLASGNCSVNRQAANQCLSRIKALECSSVSADVSRLSSLVAGPLLACAESITCR